MYISTKILARKLEIIDSLCFGAVKKYPSPHTFNLREEWSSWKSYLILHYFSNEILMQRREIIALIFSKTYILNEIYEEEN